MELVENKIFDEERALYGKTKLHLKNCRFDGPADGESALKECRDIQVEDTLFNLRYPLWHVRGLKVGGSELTSLCRAALWYCSHVDVSGSRLHGIKALRECSDVSMADCDILSTEFGWSVRNMNMRHCTVEGAYFMLRSENLKLYNVQFKGKYSFQYIKNSIIEN